MNTPLTLAVVGYGQAATLLHEAFTAQPEVFCRWVVGRTEDGAAEFAAHHAIPHHTTDLAAALADPEVDGVIVATPHALHFEQAQLALRAGKHVVVEVPMTLDAGDAQRLVDAAADRGLVISVPHIARYLDINLAAKQILESGELGQIYQFVYRRLWRQRGVGQMMNRPRTWVDTVAWHHAAHPVDLAMWLLDEPMACLGAAIGHDRGVGNAVDLTANFVTPSGVLVTVVMSYNAQQPFSDTLILGEHGVLESQGFATLKRQGEVVVAPEDALTVQGRAYTRYAAGVVESLRRGTPAPVSGAEVLPTMVQLQRIHDLAARTPQRNPTKES